MAFIPKSKPYLNQYFHIGDQVEIEGQHANFAKLGQKIQMIITRKELKQEPEGRDYWDKVFKDQEE